MFVGESNLGERRRSEDCSPPSWARFHFHLYYGPGSTFTFNSIMGKFHFHFLLNHGKVSLSLSANHVIVPLHKISDTKIIIRDGELTVTRWSQASSSGTRRPLPAFPFSDARWDPRGCAWFLCPLRLVIFGNFNIKMLLQAITHVLNTAEGQDEGKKLKIII